MVDEEGVQNRDRDRAQQRGTHQLAPVELVTVDQLLDTLDREKAAPFICKIDIEGGEANLFRCNYAWLERFPLVIIELHDWLLPGEGNSRNFLKAALEFDFDFVYRGENLFCFNNALLKEYA